MNFEYRLLILEPDRNIYDPSNKNYIEAQINALGREGWELVQLQAQSGSSRQVYVFKRPLK